MIQQDHLQIFDLTLNVWAPLFVGNGSSYTKKEYMYNTRSLCLASSPISGPF